MTEQARRDPDMDYEQRDRMLGIAFGTEQARETPEPLTPTLDNHPRGGLLAPIPCKCGVLHASRGKQHAHVRKHPECRRTRAETRALYEARWPERRAASEARKQARRYETPEGRAKMSARQKVRRAVDTGRLVKTPCQVCGSEPVQGHHHNGYAVEHQLDVVWLCVDHHAAVHRALREQAA